MSVVTDWTAIARDVAEHIYGSPNPRLSNSKELRFGRKGSKALRLDTGIFVDFEDDKKGRGVLALVEHTQGLDRAGRIGLAPIKGLLVGTSQRCFSPNFPTRKRHIPQFDKKFPETRQAQRRRTGGQH